MPTAISLATSKRGARNLQADDSCLAFLKYLVGAQSKPEPRRHAGRVRHQAVPKG